MSLPVFDNHDARIRYVPLLLEADLAGIGEIPLPAGYHYALYQPGDRDAWIAIEISAKELMDEEQGLAVWQEYYGGHEAELLQRMVFVVNDAGERVATATAYRDIRGLDLSGDGWLHWVAVRRQDQGKGLAKPLITHTLQMMKELGYTHAKIPTQPNTWLACRIYLDLGFQPVPENLESSLAGWRIVKRLTDHPALLGIDPAEDGEILNPMTVDILTIFPGMFDSVLNASILGRAREQGLIEIEATDIRPFSASKHKNTDDYPFGGGAGMLMMAQPIADCIKAVCKKRGVLCKKNTEERAKARDLLPEQANGETACPQHTPDAEEPADRRVKRIYLSPRGVKLTQKIAQELAKESHLILLCGHYEGVDQRVLDQYIDLEISIGDYVLTGGELGAMVLTDCVARLIPGVLGSEESPLDESFSDAGLLEYPQYTRPRVFEGMEVPDVLLNGDHARIAAWRREQALRVTAERRPELLQAAKLTEKERKMLFPE